jgi:NAD+ synthase
MLDGFRDAQALQRVLSRIEDSHPGGYDALIDHITKALAQEAEPSGFVVALSGGVDSSVVTALAARAGPVRAITMPARRDDSESQRLSEMLCAYFGIELIAAPIHEVVEAEIEAVNRAAPPALRIEREKADPIRLGNLASRTRILLLYDFARTLGARVLGTSNRTEFLLGYAAKFGTPMSYDLGVLDCLYKLDVRRIAERLDLPVEIRRATASTGYYRGQTHEEELGYCYESLDAACFLLFEQGIAPETAVCEWGATAELIASVLNRYRLGAHKRRLHPNYLRLKTFSDD